MQHAPLSPHCALAFAIAYHLLGKGRLPTNMLDEVVYAVFKAIGIALMLQEVYRASPGQTPSVCRARCRATATNPRLGAKSSTNRKLTPVIVAIAPAMLASSQRAPASSQLRH